MVKTLTRWNDRYRYIYRPLFPSYVFVYPKDKVDYYRTSAMDGVCYFVKHGKDACKVSDIIIKDIQIITGRGTEIEVNNNYYQPGQQLFISDGPLAGLNCEMIEYKGKKKLLVRVNLLNRSIVVALPSENLISATA